MVSWYGVFLSLLYPAGTFIGHFLKNKLYQFGTRIKPKADFGPVYGRYKPGITSGPIPDWYRYTTGIGLVLPMIIPDWYVLKISLLILVPYF